MALQGTLDTFALPDVLRLLATTRKTGRLLVRGNRGDGSVWVDGGSVVAAETTTLRPGAAAGEVVFELLRHSEGAFTFEAGSTPAEAGAPAEVEPLLVDAERQLAEWRAIEAVVPSVDAWVTLAPELPGPTATVDAERWRTIVAVGSGSTVAAIGEVLGLTEVPVSRLVKSLVEQGFASVAPVAPHLLPATTLPGDAVDLGPFADRKTPTLDLSIDLGPFTDDVAAPAEGEPDPSWAEPEPLVASFDDRPAPPPPPAAAPEVAAERLLAGNDDPIEADEVARQLASLSPKAARAVAAAAKAETPEEREAALAEVTGDDDEPINRGLLLKFLSSVRS